jgi:hypothetical protein
LEQLGSLNEKSPLPHEYRADTNEFKRILDAERIPPVSFPPPAVQPNGVQDDENSSGSSGIRSDGEVADSGDVVEDSAERSIADFPTRFSRESWAAVFVRRIDGNQLKPALSVAANALRMRGLEAEIVD